MSLLLALSPALVSIALALWSRRVVPSLGAGVLVGAVVSTTSAIQAGDLFAPIRAALTFVLDAIAPGLGAIVGVAAGPAPAWWDLDTSHLAITLFSLAVAAMVGLLSGSGATRALVRSVEGLARGRRGAQLAAWFAGMIVFFDDYANCLVVGSAMGPVFDRYQISRAKLSYIVDCTAAPVASLALVSTWIGYQVGLLGEELDKAGQDRSAFELFLSAWPYGFYGLFTMVMVGAIVWTGRDFGPMRREEERAAAKAAPVEVEASSQLPGAWVALVPVGALLALTLGVLMVEGSLGLIADGAGRPAAEILWEAGLGGVLSNADPYRALVIASLTSLALGFLTTLGSGALRPAGVGGALRGGLHPMGEALAVLLLAWSLGNAMGATQADERLLDLLAPDDHVVFQGQPVEVPAHAAAQVVSATLQVDDPSGRRVDTRPLGPLSAGPLQVRWDGLAGAGAVPPGTYRLQVDATDAEGEPVRVLIRGKERFPSFLLPAIVFLVAAGTSFATGTSFGTMGILIPLAVPLALGVTTDPMDPVLLGSVGAVLAGAIFGDHASPISDTTVLSALGSGVDLMTHVRTQLPYAASAGVIALLVGYIPAGLGVSPWLLLVLGAAVTVGWVALVGRPLRADRPPA